MNTTADTTRRRRHALTLLVAGLLLLLFAGVTYHLTHQHWVNTQRQATADAMFGLNYGQATDPPSTLVPVVEAIAGAVLTTIAIAVLLILPTRTDG